MLFPCSPEECFSMSIEAFDFAEKFQTPVFVMTSISTWVRRTTGWPIRSCYPEKPAPDRGKVLTAEDLDWLGGFSPATRTWMATASATARSPAPIIPWPLTLPPRQRCTMRRPSTPSAKTITSTTWTGWRTSSKPCAKYCRRRLCERPKAPKSASWPSARPTMRCAKAATSCAPSMGSRPAYMRFLAYRFHEQLLDPGYPQP